MAVTDQRTVCEQCLKSVPFGESVYVVTLRRYLDTLDLTLCKRCFLSRKAVR